MTKLYEIFSGEELKIAEKIQQRRYQMLVHSYIYYELDKNIVSDSQWSRWAVELAELQSSYKEIAETVIYSADFANWDGSSGAFLTYADKPNIIATAERLLQHKSKQKLPIISTPQPKKPLISKTNVPKKKLF